MGEKDSKPRLGCFPLYPPVELFHAMGLHPVVLWGPALEVDGLAESDRHLQSYSCSVARRLVQYTLTRPDSLDGLFMYNACDTLRNLPEIIGAGLGEKGRKLPFFKLHLPMGFRDQVDATGYFRRRLNALIGELKQVYGTEFEPERFRQSALLYGQVRELSHTLEEQVAAGRLSYAEFSDCLQRGCFTEPEEQLKALQALEQEGSRRTGDGEREKHCRVVISGILAPPRPLIEIIERAGLLIVGNDIASQRRSYGCRPAAAGDPLRYYHDFYTNRIACPTLLYTSDRRVEELLAYVRDRGAAGVIFAGEKFCEYEYFEFPFLQRRLKEQGVHSLPLELSADNTGKAGAFETRIEAFAEMLSGS